MRCKALSCVSVVLFVDGATKSLVLIVACNLLIRKYIISTDVTLIGVAVDSLRAALHVGSNQSASDVADMRSELQIRRSFYRIRTLYPLHKKLSKSQALSLRPARRPARPSDGHTCYDPQDDL